MSDIYYGMGQYRYNNDTKYVSLIENCSIDWITLNNTNYRDLIIQLPDGRQFEQGKSYLLELHLPQNTVYNITSDIKLMQHINGTEKILDEKRYQQIKRILIPKDENSLEVSTVVLYKDPDLEEDKVYAGVLRKSKDECEIFDVFAEEKESQDSSIEEYDYKYRKNATNFSNPIIQRVFTEVAQSFEEETSTNFKTYKLIFSPKVDLKFDSIVLEIIRQSYDEDIFYVANNQTYQGVYIDKDQENLFSVNISEITELLGQTNEEGIQRNTINHIGIWGHPDLMLAINGEEIHIGQSGFYEINDYTITSFGVAAKDNDDKFIIDYQYEIE